MQTKAIDVSFCQKTVNFRAVRQSGIPAVIVRNGYLGKTDDAFHAHMANAINAGMDIGTYTYVMSETPEQARKEARETIQRLENYKGKLNYPVFADMESTKYETSRFNKQSRTKILLAFLDEIEKGGYYSAVYINPSWLETYVDKSQILGRYDIWLAAWTNSADKPTRYQYGQTMWQWGTASVSGIKGGPVDSDLVYIDYPAKIKQAQKNYLERLKVVELAFDAAVRSEPSANSRRLGLLTAGTKCVVSLGTETQDPATGYIYIRLGGEKSQWIVKSAIK